MILLIVLAFIFLFNSTLSGFLIEPIAEWRENPRIDLRSFDYGVVQLKESEMPEQGCNRADKSSQFVPCAFPKYDLPYSAFYLPLQLQESKKKIFGEIYSGFFHLSKNASYVFCMRPGADLDLELPCSMLRNRARKLGNYAYWSEFYAHNLLQSMDRGSKVRKTNLEVLINNVIKLTNRLGKKLDESFSYWQTHRHQVEKINFVPLLKTLNKIENAALYTKFQKQKSAQGKSASNTAYQNLENKLFLLYLETSLMQHSIDAFNANRHPGMCDDVERFTCEKPGSA